MSPRSYRLGRREELVERTRSRIVSATRTVLIDGGASRLSVDEVARVADVARATVYYQFGSKVGLLEAVVADVRRRAGQDEVDLALEQVDPVAALQDVVARGCRFWATEHEIVRAVSALAAGDPEIRRVLSAADEHRHALVGQLAGQLEVSGRLRPGCSRERAVDVLTLLFSFETFDQLHTGRGLPLHEVVAVLTELAAALLDPPQRAVTAGTTKTAASSQSHPAVLFEPSRDAPQEPWNAGD